MPIRYHKKIKINDAIDLNLSKSGPSLSIGPKGAKVTVNKNGANVRAGLPGTGISYNKKIGRSKTSRRSSRNSRSTKSNSKFMLLFVAGVGLIYAGYTYPEYHFCLYIGIGAVLLYLAILYFGNRRKNADNSEPETRNATPTTTTRKTTARKPRTTARNKSAATPVDDEEEETDEAEAPFQLSEMQKQQLLDRLHHIPELQQLDPKFVEVAKLIVYYHDADPQLLQSKTNLPQERVATILSQLELLGLIGVPQQDGTRTPLVQNEDELAAILEVIF